MEILKRVHIEQHHKIWVGKNKDDYLLLFKGRYQVPYSEPAIWKDWNDAEWLAKQLIDPIAEDTRSEEELKARYRPAMPDRSDDGCHESNS